MELTAIVAPLTPPKSRRPVLTRLYRRYLTDENTASFIKAVSQRYTIATLETLATHGGRTTRRAAVLALGFLSGYESNAVLGRALRDTDRGVRIIAENAIVELWLRAGSEAQRQRLAALARLNVSGQFERAVDVATDLIDEAPWIAEAWNQRAIAYFHLDQFDDSANDCLQTLELNPFHFAAAVGMANCYLELDDAFAALECFRRALRLNPDLEAVRAQVAYLQRTLEGK